MSKVIVGLSTSLDGVASGTSETDFWDVHNAVLGWVFTLASWRAAQGMDGGEDTEDSRLWQWQNERIGAQIVGRRMFDFGYEPWGEEPPFRLAPGQRSFVSPPMQKRAVEEPAAAQRSSGGPSRS